MLGRDYVTSVLKDFRNSSISAPDKALFALVEKAGTASFKVTREDVDAVRSAGLSDEAIYDALTVVSLFKFYNTWIDSTGVHDLPSMAYGMMATRMAEKGYLPLDA
ncbi:MAG: peroxidase [Planctomycetes bacterium]|nr:peroxidase [Planctomycetota bacterium]